MESTTGEGGFSTQRLVEIGGQTALAALLGVSGLAMYIFWAILLFSLVAPGGDPSAVTETVINAVGIALGMGTAVAGYLWTSGRGFEYLDLAVPTRRDAAWAVVGVVAIFAVLYVIGFLVSLFGIEQATHGTVTSAMEDPTVALVSIPLSWLLIGPGEELMFRNVVQKTLYDAYSRPVAVVVATVIFAAVHFNAYWAPGQSMGQILASLAITFFLALILGIVYERTRSLVVAAFVHGTFNAVQFADLYCQLTGCWFLLP